MLPLAILPAAAGVAGLASGIANFASARAEANAMMPEEYKNRLRQLRAQRDAGQMGLTEQQQGRMVGDMAAARGGMLADAQARQLQQGLAMAGGGAVNARDMFLSEQANQQAQQQALAQQQQALLDADRIAAEQNRQQLMELAQREASADAARKQAAWGLVGDIAQTGAQVGAGMYGANKMGKAAEYGIYTQQGRTAAMQAQMAAGMLGAMGGPMAGAMSGAMMPAYQPVPAQPVRPAGFADFASASMNVPTTRYHFLP